jgi:hypothetical protein
MDIPIELPLDEGFLRRQCPSCQRQFKWFSGATEGRPPDFVDPDAYFCPYCGEEAAVDAWWTDEQIEYAQGLVGHEAHGLLERELRDSLRGLNRSGLIRVKIDSSPSSPPPLLTEPGDMIVVEPPCHPWEPVKVDDSWREPIHCIVCGALYVAE